MDQRVIFISNERLLQIFPLNKQDKTSSIGCLTTVLHIDGMCLSVHTYTYNSSIKLFIYSTLDNSSRVRMLHNFI